MNLTLTYGIMPTREQYDEAWNYEVAGGESGEFGFARDARVGTCRMTRDRLWDELQKAHREWDAPTDDADAQDAAGEWCSSVLGCLSIEWV